ncbi:MAG TPA: prepilin-type N-terminal cleavage/methylation domain-containing protein [Phycisphaerae bacterium]|nr:prepilin-type N-terminal cleavage/methylation domain-containing protein [Phycisphaerae bacterium]HRW53690.1 prepilin-type N-terminal cleavage/methylation domain-containing protein [Phycisphaerae bacterium]
MTRRGFTLIEVMMVVVVATILFVAAMPDSGAIDTQRGRNFAMKLESDIAYAQSMSIANPIDPIVIQVDLANDRYHLARKSDTSTAITNERTGRAYIVSTDGDFQGVNITGVDFNGDDAVGFDGVGVPDQDVPALVQITSGESTFEIAISPTTGMTTTRTTMTKVIPVETVAAASGLTRSIGEDTSVITRETGEETIVDETADKTTRTNVTDAVSDLLDDLLGG